MFKWFKRSKVNEYVFVSGLDRAYPHKIVVKAKSYEEAEAKVFSEHWQQVVGGVRLHMVNGQRAWWNAATGEVEVIK